MSSLESLQRWYNSQCDHDWEHSFGISIETLDNPGWSVTIDLWSTELEGVTMPSFRQNSGEEDWVHCWVENNQFRGAGDPFKLDAILSVFEQLLSSQDIRSEKVVSTSSAPLLPELGKGAGG